MKIEFLCENDLEDKDLYISALKNQKVETRFYTCFTPPKEPFLFNDADMLFVGSSLDTVHLRSYLGKIRSSGFQKSIVLLTKQNKIQVQEYRMEYEKDLMHLVDGIIPERLELPWLESEIRKGKVFSRYLDILAILEDSLIPYLDNPISKSCKILIRDRIRYTEAVMTLSSLEETQSGETLEHALRAGLLSKLIAQRIGLDPVFCNHIELAAPLHDLGMISVPDNVLAKTGGLSRDEWKEIKNHGLRGWFMLHYCGCPVLEMASEICLTHHERWDGRGYPEGLSKNNIPTAGKITALADSFDAMMSFRPYKKEILFEESMDEVKRKSKTQFCPICAYAIKGLQDELRLLYSNPREYVI